MRVDPAAGAAVMATGIVSLDVRTVSGAALADALAWTAVAIAAGLAVAAVRAATRADLRSSAVRARPASLTAIAGTSVIGSCFAAAGATAVGWLLLALAAALWCVLTVAVLRAWRRPTTGTSFLLAVATQSLAVLAAALAARAGASWAVWAAIALLVAGTGAYAFVLSSFDLRALLRADGDHWVAGGALAITALACLDALYAARANALPAGLVDALGDAGIVLCCAAAAWLPPLVAGELVRPRLRYSVRRWATVFPVGMYAAVCLSAPRAEGWPWPRPAGAVLAWIALALWALVGVAALRRPARALAAGRRSPR